MVATGPIVKGKKTKDSSPLGCYAMLIGEQLPAFHRTVVAFIISVAIHLLTQHYIPEDVQLHQHCCENLHLALWYIV